MADAQGPRTPVLHQDQRWGRHHVGRSRLCGGLHRRPLFLGLEVWDDVLPEEAQRVQDFLVLGGPDGTQQEDFLHAQRFIPLENRMRSSGVPTQKVVPRSRTSWGVGSPGCGPLARR